MMIVDGMDVCPIGMYVGLCVSVTLVHPAKAIGRNEMLFGRDIRAVPSNMTVLDKGSGSPAGRFGREQ